MQSTSKNCVRKVKITVLTIIFYVEHPKASENILDKERLMSAKVKRKIFHGIFYGSCHVFCMC